MGRFSRSDAPRVVGFDFGPPAGPPAPAPVEPPPAPVGVPAEPAFAAPVEPPVTAPVPPPPPAFAAAAPAWAAAPAAPPAYGGPPAYAPPPAYGGPPAYTPPPAYAPPPAAYAPPSPYQVPSGGFPGPMPAPPGAGKKSSDAKVVVGAVVGVVALVAGAAFVMGGKDDPKPPPVAARRAAAPKESTPPRILGLRTPLRVGSAPRIRDAQVRDLEVMIESSAPEGLQPRAAFYGTLLDPRYMLITGRPNGMSSKKFFGEITTELRGTVNAGAATTTKDGYTCSRFTGADGGGSLCVWSTQSSVGLLTWYGSGDTGRLAAQSRTVHAQVEGRQR